MNSTAMDSPILPQFFTNPIQALHKLRNAGFTEQQAEAQIEVFSEYVEANLATKRDLSDLEMTLNARTRELEINVEAKLREMELKLTMKIGAITTGIVGFFYVLERFF